MMRSISALFLMGVVFLVVPCPVFGEDGGNCGGSAGRGACCSCKCQVTEGIVCNHPVCDGTANGCDCHKEKEESSIFGSLLRVFTDWFLWFKLIMGDIVTKIWTAHVLLWKAGWVLGSDYIEWIGTELFRWLKWAVDNSLDIGILMFDAIIGYLPEVVIPDGFRNGLNQAKWYVSALDRVLPVSIV